MPDILQSRFYDAAKLGSIVISSRARLAFTLVEILLAIALIAAMAALIAGAVVVSEDSLSQRPAEAVLGTAIKRARDEARVRGRSVSLSFDNRGFFQISDIETMKSLVRIFLDAKKNKKELERVKKMQEAESSSKASEDFASKFFSSLADGQTSWDFLDEEKDDFLSSAEDEKPEFIFYQNYPKVLNSISIRFPEEPMKFLRFAPDGSMSHARILLKRGQSETYFDSDIFCAPPKKEEKNEGDSFVK